jgi:hypothetical protein
VIHPPSFNGGRCAFEDYRLNAVAFSGKGMAALRSCLRGNTTFVKIVT